MRILATVWLGLGILLSSISGAVADEMGLRIEIKDKVQSLLTGGRYAELDAFIDELRRKDERTPSGKWKLQIVEDGFNAIFNGPDRLPDDWSLVTRLVEGWIAASPESPNARLEMGRLLYERGWSIRGPGLADTMAPGDWRPFRDYVEDARKYLDQNHTLIGDDPRWYALMIGIAGSQDWPADRYSTLVTDGIKKFPRYAPIYQQAAWFVLPRWGGGSEDVENFAEDVLHLAPRDEADSIYARIIWSTFIEDWDAGRLPRGKFDWSWMKRGMADIAAAYPDPYNINSFAKFSCFLQDKAFATDMFRKLGDNFIQSAWPGILVYKKCRDWALSG